MKKFLFQFIPSITLIAGMILLTGCPSDSSSNRKSSSTDKFGYITDPAYVASNSKRLNDETVIIHELGNPDMLHPINSTSANSTYIEGNIFMTLGSQDPETLEKMGGLAIGRPTMELMEVEVDGNMQQGMKLVWEIRPEAVWDDGSPVTGYDYLFTIKSILNPKTDCQPLKPYFDFVKEVTVDPENPKKITVISKDTYMLVEEFSGYWVYPEYVYDPNKIMRNFKIQDMNSESKREALKGNAKIVEFADSWNSEKHQRENGFVVGCGPYKLERFETGQRIILKKKENWWGDQLRGKVKGFDIYPKFIQYEIINDWTTATTAMKDEGVDVMRSIDPKQFNDLRSNETFRDIYNLHIPTQYAYGYLGMNQRSKKLNDVRVRRAIAHCIDVEQIIDVIMYGLAVPTNGPIHPDKPWYNEELEGYKYDLEKANALLDEAGWTDSDGDGVRDKEIDGQNVRLELEYKHNSGNKIREQIGLLFKENARAVGIEVNIVAKEWTVFLDEVRSHNFETMFLSWIFGASMSDPKQVWHSSSAVVRGSNTVGFGSPESDAIIDELRYEYDEQKRWELSKKLQKMILDDSPVVFVYTPTNRLSIHGRFDNAKAYAIRPGYVETEWQIISSDKMAAN